ncbi:MAG: peptide ABC transporter substrate-binding protein [Clostridiales bacterium]|nr:peptide ABC transporter substrate-binding protein [Clostridiales bacterium]
MKKVLALLLATIMLLGTALTVVAEEAAPVISVYYGGGTPQSIDPALNSASNGSNTIKLGFAGLMGYQLVDGEAKIMPELAESYTISEDKLVYTFTLREGLKWSDGSDFKASELAASWSRAASEELGADYGFLYDYVDGYNGGKGPLNIVADDEARTFTVILAAPTAYFLDLCAFPTFYPVKTELADLEGAWATKVESYIGTGPFTMTKYAVDDVIAFEKNPYYWNADAVTLGGVNCLLSEDNSAILAGYESGNAVYVDTAIDPNEFDRINETYPGELTFGDMLGTWYVLFNVHKDLSPSTKQLTIQEQSKVRFALGQMINRQDLVDYVTMGGQVAATGFYPKGLSDGLNDDVRTSDMYASWYEGTATPSDINPDYTADQVEAINALIDLEYPHTGSIEGGDITFTDFPVIEFSFNNSGSNAAVMQYVQETWARVGITGQINLEPWSTLQTKLKEGDAESARMGWVADFNDCVNFLEIFISGSGNNYPRLGRKIGTYTRNSDVTKDAGLGAYYGLAGDQTWADAYDALVNEIKVETDPEVRAQKCAEAEKILMATGGAAPMYFYTKPNLLKPTVKGLIQINTGDVLWNYVTLEDN